MRYVAVFISFYDDELVFSGAPPAETAAFASAATLASASSASDVLSIRATTLRL